MIVTNDGDYVCIKCKTGYELLVEIEGDIRRCLKSSNSTCKNDQGGDFYSESKNFHALLPAKNQGCIECKSKTDFLIFSEGDYLCMPLDGIEDDFEDDV